LNFSTNSLKRLNTPLTFYSYLGAHSFLIGLLPFYLPVFLWGRGFDLAAIALLIGATGASFVACLGPWQTAAKSKALAQILKLTFVIELGFIASLFAWQWLTEQDHLGQSIPIPIAAVVIGSLSGAYNAWFWTTQRTLFLSMTENTNTGRQYGNFQIFVTVFLKVGILIGGLLLDADAFVWLLALSAIICASMILWYRFALGDDTLSISDGPQVTLTSSFRYKDQCRSLTIFILDGLFLFLESHFWLLSLFLVVQEDFSSLGLMVVALAVFFAVTFWLLKNAIDAFSGNSIYVVATALYALSWLLRAAIDSDMNRNALLIGLMIITFCSSFFRLAFNKRFFDLARLRGGTHYLLVKSYVSQCILAATYVTLSIVLFAMPGSGDAYFPMIYGAAAVLSLGYALYRRPQP